MTSEATMPNPADLLGKATNHVKEVVAGIQQSQLSDSTPCSEWDVHGLINHLIGGLEFAAGSMAGNPPNIQLAAAVSSHIGEHDASNLSQAYRDEVDRVLELASQPGTLEKVASTPFGDMPMSQFLVGTWLDQFIHCWDLAKATGQDTTLEQELVDFAFPMLKSGFADMGRGAGFIAPEIALPDGVSRQDQMMAYMGRQP